MDPALPERRSQWEIQHRQEPRQKAPIPTSADLTLDGVAPTTSDWSAKFGNLNDEEKRVEDPTFGYLRLGEFADLNELGQSMNRVSPAGEPIGAFGWHGVLHTALAGNMVKY